MLFDLDRLKVSGEDNDLQYRSKDSNQGGDDRHDDGWLSKKNKGSKGLLCLLIVVSLLLECNTYDSSVVSS